MNAFSDVHVTFGGAGPPSGGRLDNRWLPVLAEPGSVWIGTAQGESAAPVAAVSAPGWRLWAVGDVFAHRARSDDPLQRFVDDLAAGRVDPVALDAHAVLVGWETDRRRLHVWTDRMGTVHLYAGSGPGGAAVGTVLDAVAEVSTGNVDWVGITGFCGFGFYPGDRTMFEGIRILRPASWTVFDERGQLVSEQRYWNWSYEPDAARSDDDLLDEFHETWTQTVRAQIGTRRAVVPISGGLDSRTVFAAAAPPTGAGAPGLRTLTYGYTATSPEIRISQEVGSARGVPCDAFVVEPYLLDRIHDVTGAVEGFQSLSVSRQAGISGPLAALGERVVGGHWGDVWFDTAGGAAPGELIDVALGKFTKSGSSWLLEHLCAPHLGGEQPGDVLRNVLGDELARLPVLGDRDLTLKALKTEQWSFRWTLASVRAYQLGLPTLLPFYANDVVDFFLRVPSTRLAGRRLQTAYLRRHHPDLARVTWQDTGMSLFERPWEPAKALAARAIRKAVRTARRQTVVERNWELQYLTEPGPQVLRRTLLDPDSPLAALTAPGMLADLFGAFLGRPDAANGYAVDALMTLDARLGSTR